MKTADMILKQLGSHKFATMTGAKNFLADGDALSFQLPARFAKKGINYVKISLESDDTYTMKFIKYFGVKVTEIAQHAGVYADHLQSIFTAETGLDTHL